MADTAKHTRGPWRVSEQCAQLIDIRHDNNEPGAISLTLAKVVARPTWQREAEANARLIAAAPELLEALEEALDVIATLSGKDNSCDEPYCVDDLHALVARVKATGSAS